MAGEAKTVQVAGLATIQVCLEGGDSDELIDLGYTRNGVEISSQGFFLDVPGDQFGGDDGPPVDVQYMGETATIRLELTKWNQVTAELVEARMKGAAAGVPEAPGTLVFGDTKAWRVLIVTSNAARLRNYLRCFPRNVVEVNKGTRFSTLVVEFEAHEGAGGVLWNTVTA